ncbi:MAG: Smr/MutS family protein [Xanthomonadales bacterium]|nr:Smr/MutS family protein [Xanthomonadales bacterium]
MHDPHDPLDAWDDDDPALLHAAVGPVRRIHAEEAPKRPRPDARARSLEQDEREAVRTAQHAPFSLAEPGESSRYRRDEVPARTLKRLAKGLFAVQDEFDLHWLGAEQALAATRRFLAEARAADLRCVRLIHGKGTRSQGGESVLRPRVEAHLMQRADVLAFASAPTNQGGTGALLVLLKSDRGG